MRRDMRYRDMRYRGPETPRRRRRTDPTNPRKDYGGRSVTAPSSTVDVAGAIGFIVLLGVVYWAALRG